VVLVSEQPWYRACLLWLWRVGNGGPPARWASLEAPHTGERRGFADLEQLFAFLEVRAADNTGFDERPSAVEG
jgi:hypothetical protein